MTEPHAPDVPLLDTLPCYGGDGDVAWETLTLPLAAQTGDLFGADSHTPTQWLCAALLAVERACTGRDSVIATVDSGDGLRQGRVALGEHVAAGHWLNALSPLGQPVADATAPWAVLPAISGAAEPADPSRSTCR